MSDKKEDKKKQDELEEAEVLLMIIGEHLASPKLWCKLAGLSIFWISGFTLGAMTAYC